MNLSLSLCIVFPLQQSKFPINQSIKNRSTHFSWPFLSGVQLMLVIFSALKKVVMKRKLKKTLSRKNFAWKKLNNFFKEQLCPDGRIASGSGSGSGISVLGWSDRSDELALEALPARNPVFLGTRRVPDIRASGNFCQLHGPGQSAVHLLALEVLLHGVDVDLEQVIGRR